MKTPHLLLSVLASLVIAEAGHAREVVRVFDYRDDEDLKINAEVRATLSFQKDGLGRLQLNLSAKAPFVDPQPGFDGLRGYNRHTAWQLEGLTDPHGLFYFAVFKEDGAFVSGHQEVTRTYGPIPERRLREDGSIDYFHLPSRPSVLRITTSTALLPTGRYTAEIWARNEPRMRLHFEIAGGTGRIHRFENVT
ncbi:MAG: hypothetical protein AAF492_26995, partial [Verrucomicrobiota bacterium]